LKAIWRNGYSPSAVTWRLTFARRRTE
jgi:hypothetical protein